MDGDFNIVKWKNADALLNQRILKVEVADPSKLNLNFIYYWLDPYVRKVNDLTSATTVKHLSVRDIVRASDKLPRVSEQKKIAAILTSIDTAIENTEALIEKYQQIKAGLMHDLFTRGVLPNGQLRPTREQAPQLYQQTVIGWIPKEWDVPELRELLSSITYGFTNPMPEADDGPYLITAADVVNGAIQFGTCRKTTRLAFETLLTNKSRPKIGDILLTKDGTLGRLAIVDRDYACVNQSVAVLRPVNVGDSEFLFFLLASKKYQDKMTADAGGSTIKHIYITVVNRMQIAIPKSERERELLTHGARTVERKISHELCQLMKLKAQKLGLMQDLLTGKVQVKVDSEAAELAHA